MGTKIRISEQKTKCYLSFFAETPHHPTKIYRKAFIYWGLSVVECLKTPHQHYTNTPPKAFNLI